MSIGDLKIFTQTYNGNTRKFFEIPGTKIHGYISLDNLTYFLYNDDTNSYKDFSAAELDDYLKNGGNSFVNTVEDLTKKPAEFFSNIVQTDAGKVSTGLILLGALFLGVLIFNKK